MFKINDYYYKGYEIENKSRLEKLVMGYSNPYGPNLGSNSRRIIDYQKSATFTNQDNTKLKITK